MNDAMEVVLAYGTEYLTEYPLHRHGPSSYTPFLDAWSEAEVLDGQAAYELEASCQE